MGTNKKIILLIIAIASVAVGTYYFYGQNSMKAISMKNQMEPVKISASSFVPIDSNAEMVKQQSRLIVIEGFHASMLNNDRSLHVYLPPGYYSNKDKKFPVLYVHDGKSVFELSDWSKESLNMHITADRLISEGRIQEVIIVGIDNIAESRMNEYTHWNGVDMGKPIKGKGLLYEDFVINDVKPFIDKNFRTLADRENTALMGASIGGFSTFNIGFRHSEVFSKLAMLSPYLGWGDGRLYKEISQGYFKDKKPLKMWIDVGSEEGGFVDMAAYGILLLYQNGYKYAEELAAYEAPGGGHSERYWAERVAPVLVYFYGDIGKPVSVELFTNKTISTKDSQIAHVNAVLTYDSGFKMTDLFGSFEVEKPEVLKVEPLGGALTPLSAGTTKIKFTSSSGLTAITEATVVTE